MGWGLQKTCSTVCVTFISCLDIKGLSDSYSTSDSDKGSIGMYSNIGIGHYRNRSVWIYCNTCRLRWLSCQVQTNTGSQNIHLLQLWLVNSYLVRSFCEFAESNYNKIITACIRRMEQANVFSLFTTGGEGGYPSQVPSSFPTLWSHVPYWRYPNLWSHVPSGGGGLGYLSSGHWGRSLRNLTLILPTFFSHFFITCLTAQKWCWYTLSILCPV